MNKGDYFVPFEKLSEGFEACKQQATLLLESCTLLYNSKKYVSAIPLAILALEECTKLTIISKCKYEKRGITKEEWTGIIKGGSHVHKLMKPELDGRAEIISKGEKAFNITTQNQKNLGSSLPVTFEDVKSMHVDEEWYKGLNEIKKLCLYVDWKNSKWFSFLNNFSKDQKKGVAKFLIDYVEFAYNNEVIGYKYPHFPRDENSSEFKEFQEDPLWKRALELEKIVRSNEFQTKKILLQSIIKDIKNST